MPSLASNNAKQRQLFLIVLLKTGIVQLKNSYNRGLNKQALSTWQDHCQNYFLSLQK